MRKAFYQHVRQNFFMYFPSRFQKLHYFALLIVAIFGLSSALYWSGLLKAQRQQYEEALARNEQRGLQLSAAVAQQVDTLIKSYDLAAQQLRNDYLYAPQQFDHSVRIITNAFPKEAIGLVLIYDAEGYLVYSSGGAHQRANFGDREYFSTHLKNNEDRLFIGKPEQSKIENEWVIMLTRPIRKDGKLLGVIALSLRPTYLADRLSALSLSTSDSLNISRSDGVILARSGDLKQAMGKMLPPSLPSVNAPAEAHGVYRTASVVDHLPRLYAWKRLRDWPLLVIIGINEHNELAFIDSNNAASHQRSGFATLMLFLFTLGIASLLIRLEKQRTLLHASEKRYRTIFENNTSIKMLVDPSDGRIVDINQAAIDFYGYSREAFLDKTVYEINTQPADLIKSELEDAAGQQCQYFNLQHRLASGAICDVEIYTGPVDMGDKPLLFSIIHDVTSRKELERRLQENEALTSSVLDGAAFSIIATDKHGTVTIFNRGAENLLGYRAEEVINKETPLLWHAPEEIASRAQVLSKELGYPISADFACFATRTEIGGIADEGEWTYIRKDGKRISVLLSVTGIRNQQGEITGFVGISHDISASKATESELRRSNTELEQFAYAASHDMRQPLRMIASYLQLLEKELHGKLSEDAAEYLNFALDGARRLDQMLLSLLEYSRVGRKSGEKIELPSREALDEALSFLQPAVQECAAEIMISGEWPTLHASRDEIMRLFQNLIGNAIKYHLPEVPPKIAIVSKASKHHWRVTISDNGAGFASNQAGRLFQVFQRLHARTRYEGSGVGLAICRKIVEHHGGSISGTSAGEGQGSSFTFSLPLSEDISS